MNLLKNRQTKFVRFFYQVHCAVGKIDRRSAENAAWQSRELSARAVGISEKCVSRRSFGVE